MSTEPQPTTGLLQRNVLLTVPFVSVLHFGGIARDFDSRMVRNIFAILALALFLMTLAGLLTMPI